MFRKKIISLFILLSLLTSVSFGTAYDKDGLMSEIYNHASNFETEFTVGYSGDIKELGDLLELINTTISYDDYVYWSLSKYGYSYEHSKDKYDIAVSLEYNSPAGKEKFVDDYVEAQLKLLKLEGLSDYARARAIAVFLEDNFQYDRELVIHDTYTMITTKTGVCQAYGLLFYKMAKGAGLQVRTQEGTLDGGPHLWNLVKIKDTWFHVDPTNTHFRLDYNIFMKSNQYVISHDYTWTTLGQAVAETDVEPDKTYTSGNYLESNIKSAIHQNIKDYVESAASKQARIKQETAAANEENLRSAMADLITSPSKITYAQLAKVSATMIVKKDSLESDALDLLLSTKKSNVEALKVIYTQYLDTIQLLKSGTTEQSKLDYLKSGKETIASLKDNAYDNSSLDAYIPAINARNKAMADTLVRFYMTNAEKSKNKTYKDKAIALAKEYNFKDLLAKASKLKVK